MKETEEFKQWAQNTLLLFGLFSISYRMKLISVTIPEMKNGRGDKLVYYFLEKTYAITLLGNQQRLEVHLKESIFFLLIDKNL